MTPKLRIIAVLLVAVAIMGCSKPTQPLQPPASLVGSVAPGASTQPAGVLHGIENGRSQAPQVSGAFRHDDFVITVHGVRLGPASMVQATYDLDRNSKWPLGWPDGMDFLTSMDGRLWEDLHNGTFFPVNTGAVARLRDGGEGFTYSVPLSAMHEPTGPITFAIIVGGYSSYYFRAFGRAEFGRPARERAVLVLTGPGTS